MQTRRREDEPRDRRFIASDSRNHERNVHKRINILVEIHYLQSVPCRTGNFLRSTDNRESCANRSGFARERYQMCAVQ